jgi:hypothetical protein
MAETNEEEEAAGLLRFTIGGQPRQVPELKWRANREWQARMQAVFTRLVDIPSDTPEGQNAMADAERELVLAYDVTGALGDLEDATERELDDVYNRLVAVSFPLAQSQTALAMMLVRAAVSAQASSTNSDSAPGISAPTPLRPPSPSARSRSSTGRRRNA